MIETAAVSAMQPKPLTAEELRKMDAYWRAANYLSVGQIYHTPGRAYQPGQGCGTLETTESEI